MCHLRCVRRDLAKVQQPDTGTLETAVDAQMTERSQSTAKHEAIESRQHTADACAVTSYELLHAASSRERCWLRHPPIVTPRGRLISSTWGAGVSPREE